MDVRGKARQGVRSEEVLTGEPSTEGFVVLACAHSSVPPFVCPSLWIPRLDTSCSPASGISVCKTEKLVRQKNLKDGEASTLFICLPISVKHFLVCGLSTGDVASIGED